MNLLKRTTLLITLTLALIRLNSYGQENGFDKVDKELSALYGKIFPFYYGNRDSLNYYSELFSSRFTTFIKDNPETINYNFKSLVSSNACHIVTSADERLKIYSWDTWLGGTMHDTDNIYQFKSGNKIFATDLPRSEDKFATYFTDIFTLKTGLKTYYLVVGSGTESTKYVYEEVSIYTISKDTLGNKVKLIKTTSGLNNSIGFEYDFFSVADQPGRPIQLTKYDTEKKILYIPVVLENGKVTNRYILYRFNGEYFEKE